MVEVVMLRSSPTPIKHAVLVGVVAAVIVFKDVVDLANEESF